MQSKTWQSVICVLGIAVVAVGCGMDKPSLFNGGSRLTPFPRVPAQSEPEIVDGDIDVPASQREID